MHNHTLHNHKCKFQHYAALAWNVVNRWLPRNANYLYTVCNFLDTAASVDKLHNNLLLKILASTKSNTQDADTEFTSAGRGLYARLM